jgi:hypothetical protein
MLRRKKFKLNDSMLEKNIRHYTMMFFALQERKKKKNAAPLLFILR